MAAAVSGRAFASELVGEVADWSGPTVRCLRRSRASQTHRVRQSRWRLMFSHELIRQTLLSGASAIKREQLHLQAATAISRSTPTISRRTPESSPTTCHMPDARRIGPAWFTT